jgi:PAS domain S-box-containing protein
MKTPMDRQEDERLAELISYGILDTSPEDAFDRLTALAAQLFEAPIALVSLVDDQRQWFKSRIGLEAQSIGRELAFCAHLLDKGRDAMLVVTDATQDDRFRDNPLVTGAPDIRFYAGAALTTRSGHNLGALCVIDTEARTTRKTPTPGQLAQLRTLAKIVVDELELRRANREAREQHRLLELAESLAGVGRWRIDMATARVTWSDVVYDIHGVDQATFDPNFDDAVDFYHPDDRQAVKDAISTAVGAKGNLQFQLRLIRPDGELRHVVSKGACDLDPDGEVNAVVGVFQDVTDQINTLDEIRRSEAQYRLLAENACDLILRTDDQGLLTYVSPAATAATGYLPEEMLGRRWSQFVNPKDARRVDAAKRAQLDARGALGPKAIEYRIVHRDGHEMWLEGRPRFAMDPQTGAVGVTDVVRDISAHKEDEEELRQARAEAEAAAATKSEFLANMSHELRTPLTAVLGFSALVGEQPGLTDASRNYLGRIANAGQVLLATVNDILDFSKLESGQVDIKPIPTDPGALARDMLDLFTLQAEDKVLSLKSEGLDALPGSLPLDPDRLRQVLLNLLGNAIKFTHKGGVLLQARYDQSAGRLSLAVTDSGPGIAPEDADRLFRRFSQVDASSTRRYGGTGLGLAICKGLIEAMGGEIGVQSEVGKGSCFWVSIPAAAETGAQSIAAALPAPSLEPLIPENVAAAIPAGCRVLLAEDNQVNRALVRTVLSELDIELTEARDGLEAVEAAQAMPFDVILMDLRMPRMDGVAATRLIRSQNGPNVCAPIIAFSADAGAQLGAGLFDALVAKPLAAAALIRAMANVMATQPETRYADAGRV